MKPRKVLRFLRRRRRRRGFSVEVLRKPYLLSVADKLEMRALFDEVMKPLAFHARPAFLLRLYDTDILIRIRARGGRLVAFGNAMHRVVDSRNVLHIIAMYVAPAYRGRGLMRHAVQAWFVREALRRPSWMIRPLVVTGSALNPQVVFALARYFEVWPDLLGGGSPPPWAARIAQESATRFYPVQTGIPFQVQITDEFAGYRQQGVVQRTGHRAFDERFFAYADPSALKLLFFVVRIRLLDLIKAVLTSYGKPPRVAPGSAD